MSAITIRPAAGSGPSGGAQFPVGTFDGRILEAGGARVVQVGSLQLALPEDALLEPGQTVTVTRPAPGAPIEVRPITVGQTDSAVGNRLAEVLARVVSELQGVAQTSAEHLLPIVPQSAPLTQSQVRLLLALFTMRGSLGPDLAAAAEHLQAALASGWTAPDWIQSLIQLAGAQLENEPEAIVRWLKQAYRSSAKNAEASLAQLDSGDPIEGLAAQLQMLRNDPSLRTVLQDANRWEAFSTHVDRALDRLEGRTLHQLHALHANYVFVELPAPFPSDFSSIHLHWFREGSRQDTAESSTDQIALDLNVSQLGDLWIVIRTAGEHCTCNLHASSDRTVEMLESEASILETALRAAGYASPSVNVLPWNGDRLGAVAQLMRHAAGLDVNA